MILRSTKKMRAELKLELFRALRTRGREIRIGTAELQGLRQLLQSSTWA